MSDPNDPLVALFIEEARDVIERLSRHILDVEGSAKPAAPATLREIFRLAHTLKGSAATVHRNDIAEVAHHMESALELVRKGAKPTRELISTLLKSLDVLSAALKRPLDKGEIKKAVDAINAVMPKLGGEEPEEATSAGPGLRESLAVILERTGEVLRADTPAARVQLRESAVQLRDCLGPTTHSLTREAVELWCEILTQGGEMDPFVPGTLQAAVMLADLLQSELDGIASDEQRLVVRDQVVSLARSQQQAPEQPPPNMPAASEHPTGTGGDALHEEEASVRIPVSLLDDIVYRTDELLVLKLRFDYQRRQVEEIQGQLEAGSFSTGGAAAGEATMSEAVRRRLESLRRNLAEDIHALGLAVRAVQDNVHEVRMVPVAPVLQPLRRMTRDLAESLQKNVAVDIQAEGVRIDKRLVDITRDPLMHILRNSVDHGIEMPDERRRSGKSPTARIQVTADSRDASIWIQIRDDGRGIDPRKVRAQAVRKGMIDYETAEALSDREALNLIFTPGFSTAEEVTAISGRGVGLDVVRDNVARAGGRIEFYSELGKGTQFTVILPLTLAASSGLLVKAGRQTYCMPLSAVEEVLTVTPAQIGFAHGRAAITRRNQTTPFTRLEDVVLGRPSSLPDTGTYAIVIAISERRLAVAVDSVLSQEEVVLKGLARGTPALRFVSGATALADGRLVAVLNPAELLEAAISGSTSSSMQTRQRRTVLVADDSLTSRSMVASVLEQAGFKTILAHDVGSPGTELEFAL